MFYISCETRPDELLKRGVRRDHIVGPITIRRRRYRYRIGRKVTRGGEIRVLHPLGISQLRMAVKGPPEILRVAQETHSMAWPRNTVGVPTKFPRGGLW